MGERGEHMEHDGKGGRVRGVVRLQAENQVLAILFFNHSGGSTERLIFYLRPDVRALAIPKKKTKEEDMD
jgi:hypothetical protein